VVVSFDLLRILACTECLLIVGYSVAGCLTFCFLFEQQEFASTGSSFLKFHKTAGPKNQKAKRQAVLRDIATHAGRDEAFISDLMAKGQDLIVCILHYTVEDCELRKGKWRVKDGARPRKHAEMFGTTPVERPPVRAEDRREAAAMRAAIAQVETVEKKNMVAVVAAEVPRQGRAGGGTAAAAATPAAPTTAVAMAVETGGVAAAVAAEVPRQGRAGGGVAAASPLAVDLGQLAIESGIKDAALAAARFGAFLKFFVTVQKNFPLPARASTTSSCVWLPWSRSATRSRPIMQRSRKLPQRRTPLSKSNCRRMLPSSLRRSLTCPPMSFTRTWMPWFMCITDYGCIGHSPCQYV
jgi:hypothetical protein